MAHDGHYGLTAGGLGLNLFGHMALTTARGVRGLEFASLNPRPGLDLPRPGALIRAPGAAPYRYGCALSDGLRTLIAFEAVMPRSTIRAVCSKTTQRAITTAGTRKVDASTASNPPESPERAGP